MDTEKIEKFAFQIFEIILARFEFNNKPENPHFFERLFDSQS